MSAAPVFVWHATAVLPVAILCGGNGTRMRRSDEALPKPLVEIGGQPILWHVMSLYAAHGLSRFVLLTGHGGERIERFASTLPADWDVECVATGDETPTGGRILRVADRLRVGTFCLTYADGLADLDLEALISFHGSHPGTATMAVVRPTNPWGVVGIGPAGRVESFEEKPPLESWVTAASS